MHLGDLTLCDAISAHLVSGKAHPAVSGSPTARKARYAAEKLRPCKTALRG